jgi:hypothetical protein
VGGERRIQSATGMRVLTLGGHHGSDAFLVPGRGGRHQLAGHILQLDEMLVIHLPNGCAEALRAEGGRETGGSRMALVFFEKFPRVS